jgi:transcription elongation GreA/GreB family factor
MSPIAKALLNRKLGERIRFKFPSGEETLEIKEIRYE